MFISCVWNLILCKCIKLFSYQNVSLQMAKMELNQKYIWAALLGHWLKGYSLIDTTAAL